MFIMDVPSIPAQEPLLMVADASTTQNTAPQHDRVIGVCHLSDGSTSDGAMVPLKEVSDYYRKKEHQSIEGSFTSVSVLQVPTHGTLEGPVNGNFAYIPEKGYLGNDRASLLVEVGGKKIRMEYFFRVMQAVPEAAEGEPSIYEQGYCPKKARVWKISYVENANGNNTLAVLELEAVTSGTVGHWYGFGVVLA